MDAEGLGRVMVFEEGEDLDSGVDGFTLTGGLADRAAGLLLVGSSPMLTGCVVTQNHAGDEEYGGEDSSGGGMLLERASPVMADCVVSDNSATTYCVETYDAEGGGMHLTDSRVWMTGCELEGNAAYVNCFEPGAGTALGGGIYSERSELVLSSSRLTWNQAADRYNLEGGTGDGGGAFMYYSSLEAIDCVISDNYSAGTGGGMLMHYSSTFLERCRIERNRAEGDSGGLELFGDVALSHCTFHGNVSGEDAGGLSLTSSVPRISHCTFSENTAAESGGGVVISSTENTFSHCSFTGNRALEGGAVAMWDSSTRLESCVVVGNTATEVGGGLYLWADSGSPHISDSVLAYNTGGNLYSTPDSAYLPVLLYSDLYAQNGMVNHNLPELDPSNMTVEPGFLSYRSDGLPEDLHLSRSSPLIDRGTPEQQDPDATRMDMGLYGGPEGDGWDRDLDGWHDWFWPGSRDNAPQGFLPSDYDADDQDSERH